MSQCYLLDTNVVSHIMQGRDADLLARLTQLPGSGRDLQHHLGRTGIRPAPQTAARSLA